MNVYSAKIGFACANLRRNAVLRVQSEWGSVSKIVKFCFLPRQSRKDVFIRAVVITTFSRFVSGLKPYVFFEHMKLISKNKMTFGHI